MSLDEIRTGIKAYCEEMIDFTIKYASSIETPVKSDSQSDTSIAQILSRAKSAAKRSLAVYERFRQDIANAAVTSQQYETAIQSLANTLKI